MRKTVKQCVALTLALVMLLSDGMTSLGAEIFNDNVSVYEETEQPKVLFEMEELREESAKQYRLSDGTILAAQYGMDVHYENEEGSMKKSTIAFFMKTRKLLKILMDMPLRMGR